MRDIAFQSFGSKTVKGLVKTKCIGSPNFSFLSRFSCDGIPRHTLASHEAFFGQQLSRRVNLGSLTLLNRTKIFGSSLPIHPNHKNIHVLRLTQSPDICSRRRISFTVHSKLHNTGVQIGYNENDMEIHHTTLRYRMGEVKLLAMASWSPRRTCPPCFLLLCEHLLGNMHHCAKLGLL
jgi:hypothetical protein